MSSTAGSSKLGEVPTERVDRLPQIRYRTLKASDRQELIDLHQQCFPVHYESQFYDKALDGRLWSCVAMINALGDDATPLDARARGHSPRPTVANLSYADPASHRGGEELAAAIISQISPQGEFEDAVLHERDPAHHVAYICTLGVCPAFRKHGLATRLLAQLVAHVESEPHVKALALHVLTTNEVALRFYEGNGFRRLRLLPGFYTIGGRACDAYLYARHFHGGAPASSL
eukprot:CAMPEP_0172193050 /NCGR_PEP_ID=MMETSP1050-20130122/24718_1 /TAXON_ID=233186 /ORGANISM="Cryptomonas curvata, Strain CCAP979/52" /LENGTH=230 /DNA_ID=CAMNT_0012868521 /DNA_START=138 /DNA_END=827 /DNA_ORIENTATION=-